MGRVPVTFDADDARRIALGWSVGEWFESEMMIEDFKIADRAHLDRCAAADRDRRAREKAERKLLRAAGKCRTDAEMEDVLAQGVAEMAGWARADVFVEERLGWLREAAVDAYVWLVEEALAAAEAGREWRAAELAGLFAVGVRHFGWTGADEELLDRLEAMAAAEAEAGA